MIGRMKKVKRKAKPGRRSRYGTRTFGKDTLFLL
jgi:hypothetical protein